MQDYYYTLTVTPSTHYNVFRDFLSEIIPIGFEELDNSFIIRSDEDLETYSWSIEQFAETLQRSLGESIDVVMELKKEKSSDWMNAYKESITPVEVGGFYVHPTWHDAKEGKKNIVLDPAMAFGTGHHATTESCLYAIETFVKNDDLVLDLGCGSGILAIAAAKNGAQVDACDTDALSIENALINAEKNSVAYRRIWEGSINKADEEQYDVILANLVADVIVSLSKELKISLKKGGTLVLSGILNKYFDKVLEKFNDFDVIDKILKEEWVTLIFKKR